MTCWAIIPIKPTADRKTRLIPALAPEGRDALVRGMAARVMDAVQRARAIDRVAIVTRSDADHPAGVDLVPDSGAGLNAALAKGLEFAAANGAHRLVIVAADLPQIVPSELEEMARVGKTVVAIAPDSHGTGTNALSLPLPNAEGFAFSFGAGSLEKHRAEAERLGLSPVLVHAPGLARDIDVPEDLVHAAALMNAAP